MEEKNEDVVNVEPQTNVETQTEPLEGNQTTTNDDGTSKGPNKDNKKVITIGAIIIVILVVLFLLQSVFLNKKAIVEKEISVAFKEGRKVIDQMKKNTLDYDIEKNSLGIEGDISIDSDYKDSEIDLTKLKNYKLTYSGTLDKKGNKGSANLKLSESKDIFDLNASMKGKVLYINLGDLYNKILKTETSKEIKDFETSSITIDDIELIYNKTEKVVKESTKEDNITKENVEKEINGKKGKYQKISYKVDFNYYEEKVLESYKNDDKVLDILARMSNNTKKEMKKELEREIKDLKEREKTEVTVNLYTTGLFNSVKEIEIGEEEEKIIIDVEKSLYKYKIVSNKKEIASGIYDSNKREYTIESGDKDNKFSASMTMKNDNHLVGNISYKAYESEIKASFDFNNKISKKESKIVAKVVVNYKEGNQNFKFNVNTNQKLTVGSKVNDISDANAVDVEQLSEQDLQDIYSKAINKLDTITKEISSNFSLSDGLMDPTNYIDETGVDAEKTSIKVTSEKKTNDVEIQTGKKLSYSLLGQDYEFKIVDITP